MKKHSVIITGTKHFSILFENHFRPARRLALIIARAFDICMSNKILNYQIFDKHTLHSSLPFPFLIPDITILKSNNGSVAFVSRAIIILINAQS